MGKIGTGVRFSSKARVKAGPDFAHDLLVPIPTDCPRVSEDDCHQAAYFSYFLRSSNTYRLTVARKGHLLVKKSSEDDCHQAAYFSYFLRSSNTYRLTVARKGHLLVGIFFLSIYFYWMLTCNSKSRYLCLEISTYDSRP